MGCTEILQILDLEVAADMTLEIFLSFLFGLIMALVVILIMLVIRYRKIIITKVSVLCVLPILHISMSVPGLYAGFYLEKVNGGKLIHNMIVLQIPRPVEGNAVGEAAWGIEINLLQVVTPSVYPNELGYRILCIDLPMHKLSEDLLHSVC